jgi:hypothetical protein
MFPSLVTVVAASTSASIFVKLRQCCTFFGRGQVYQCRFVTPFAGFMKKIVQQVGQMQYGAYFE